MTARLSSYGMMEQLREHHPRSVIAQMLTREEAADYIGVHQTTLWAWKRDGKGPKSYPHKGMLLYKPADLDAWKAER